MKIEGYENYEVRPNGEVINSKTGRVLKPAKNGSGYMQVALYKNKKPKRFMVHRLVAEAFLPNPQNLPQVNHKDEDKTNNTVFVREDGSVDFDKSNLEWCDCKYNINYGTSLNRRALSRRNTDDRKKRVCQYTLDNRFVKEWDSVREIERTLGYNQRFLSRVCRGVKSNYTAYGYKWCYKK